MSIKKIHKLGSILQDSLHAKVLFNQAKPTRTEQQARNSSAVAATFRCVAVGFFVQLTALGSVHVFRPELFQMDERTLPGAVQIML